MSVSPAAWVRHQEVDSNVLQPFMSNLNDSDWRTVQDHQSSKGTLVLDFDPIQCIKEIHFDPFARKNESNIFSQGWIKMPLK